MNKLTHDQRVEVVNCLIEGCSIRATVRITGICKKTVMRLLGEVGAVCQSYQDRAFRNLSCRRIHAAESSLTNCGASTIARRRTSRQILPLELRVLAMCGFGSPLMRTQN